MQAIESTVHDFHARTYPLKVFANQRSDG